jgi:hypothetical protein
MDSMQLPLFDESITPLPQKKRQSGATFHLRQRTSKAALYERISDEGKVTYMVLKIIIVPATNYKKIKIGKREKFPGPEDGGKICWEFYDLPRALHEYTERVNKGL